MGKSVISICILLIFTPLDSYDPEQSSDPRRANSVDEFNDSVEEKKGIWVEFLSGIGALLLIVIPTYFYYKSLK